MRPEALAGWVTDHDPRRRHPVIFIGSSNGAPPHLAAALAAAWLPQTQLLPVRRRGAAVDDPKGDLCAVAGAGRALLAAHPDPVQRWRRMWDEGGPRALRSQRLASLPRLSGKQFAQLEAEPAKGPAAHGWEEQRWMLARVETVIGRRFHLASGRLRRAA
ncbi:hypothetical protein ABT218_23090 [Streptomyces sp. NPDC001455]|uniref:hypothetical protein n=1 Tax=unclassified Streptomyces TaxID=2593676 RepID=UPI00331DC6BE